MEKDQKHYYAIGEVARMLNTSVGTIRYWEKMFPLLRPKKNRRGDRMFTQRDIQLLKTIHYLLRVKGFTIEGARRHLRTHHALLLGLQKMESKLMQLHEMLVALNARPTPAKAQETDQFPPNVPSEKAADQNHQS